MPQLPRAPCDIQIQWSFYSHVRQSKTENIKGWNKLISAISAWKTTFTITKLLIITLKVRNYYNNTLCNVGRRYFYFKWHNQTPLKESNIYLHAISDLYIMPGASLPAACLLYSGLTIHSHTALKLTHVLLHMQWGISRFDFSIQSLD